MMRRTSDSFPGSFGVVDADIRELAVERAYLYTDGLSPKGMRYPTIACH